MILLLVLAWIACGVVAELLVTRWLNERCPELPPVRIKASAILSSAILGPCNLFGVVIYICFISKYRY